MWPDLTLNWRDILLIALIVYLISGWQLSKLRSLIGQDFNQTYASLHQIEKKLDEIEADIYREATDIRKRLDIATGPVDDSYGHSYGRDIP